MHSIYEPCPCNSGKKFKFCCYERIRTKSPADVARAAVQYPLYACFVGENWEEIGITNVLVAKKLPHGQFVVGIYILDVWCLGVKSADLKVNITSEELIYLKERIEGGQSLISFPYEDMRSLVLGGIVFASKLGFVPHKDWGDAGHLIEPDRPYVEKFQFGRNGEPFYVIGPYDRNSDEIIKKLEEVGGDWVVPEGEFSNSFAEVSLEEFKQLINDGEIKEEIPFELLIDQYPSLVVDWYPGYPGVPRKMTKKDPIRHKGWVKDGVLTLKGSFGLKGPSISLRDDDSLDGEREVWLVQEDDGAVTVHVIEENMAQDSPVELGG